MSKKNQTKVAIFKKNTVQKSVKKSLKIIFVTRKIDLKYISYIRWYIYLSLNKYIHICLYTQKNPNNSNNIYIVKIEIQFFF